MKNTIGIILVIIITFICITVIKQYYDTIRDDSIVKDTYVRERNKYSDGNNAIDKKIKEIIDNSNYDTAVIESEHKYESLQLDNNVNDDMASEIIYDGRNYRKLNKFIASEYIGRKLGNDKESGIELYEITHMSEKRIIVAKNDITGEYIAYMTDQYEVENLKQYLEDIGFFNIIEQLDIMIVPVTEQNCELIYDDVSLKEFYNTIKCLYEDSYIEIEENEARRITGLKINGFMSCVKEDIYIEFYENGDIGIFEYLDMKLRRFDTGETGTRFALALLEYLSEKCEGCIISYNTGT